jgi:uncharacterized peroxidase-related enzyme
MTRLPHVEPGTADTTTEELFTTARQQIGGTPNMTQAMANSPALLNGYLALSAALSRGRLRPAVREQIALAIAQRNGCDYCMSAHTFAAAQILHLEPASIAAARHAHSDDPKTGAALRLATAINDTRGGVTQAQLDTAKAAGLNDAEIAEVVGNVALNVLTNYFNKTADTDIDFPPVRTTAS